MVSPQVEIGLISKEISKCKRCNLWKARTNPVFGEGSLSAKIMFIGEAPGHNEDLQGKPFVGRAGKLFEELLHSINLKREEVYVTNLVKCRPAKNRNPFKKEINACSFYLDKQIEIIKPLLIVTLGNFAASYILKKLGLKVEKIGKIHGNVFCIKNLRVIPLYHPAVGVYNPKMREVLLKDFKSIKCYL